MNALWLMTLAEFTAAAGRGRLIPSTTVERTAEELTARTPLRLGELNDYGPDNIAHFYAWRRRDPVLGYLEMLADAEFEGRFPGAGRTQ